jgi:hypothetical protein
MYMIYISCVTWSAGDVQMVGTYCRGIIPGLWPYIWSTIIMKVSCANERCHTNVVKTIHCYGMQYHKCKGKGSSKGITVITVQQPIICTLLGLCTLAQSFPWLLRHLLVVLLSRVGMYAARAGPLYVNTPTHKHCVICIHTVFFFPIYIVWSNVICFLLVASRPCHIAAAAPSCPGTLHVSYFVQEFKPRISILSGV